MATMEIYRLGVTAGRWRCRRCRYAGRFITKDSYKRGLSSVRRYRGGFLRCPNPTCQTQGFMKRRRFDGVARVYELEPHYDEAQTDMRAAVAGQFPEAAAMERPGVLPLATPAPSMPRSGLLEPADR
jgi:hypothetical protein